LKTNNLAALEPIKLLLTGEAFLSLQSTSYKCCYTKDARTTGKDYKGSMLWSQFSAIFDNFRRFLTIFGDFWQFSAIFDNFRRFLTIFGGKKLHFSQQTMLWSHFLQKNKQ
jgi:hypothetical protein